VQGTGREHATLTTFGRYRLLERLGQGGMAEVFKAKSYGVEGFEKVVVIKRILPELAASDPFVEMFIHEAKLAVRLSHANIVQVFDLGLAPGTPPNEGDAGAMPQPDAYYMAMEYVSGFDLATVLARCRRQQVQVPIELAVYVAAEVAKGLDHAHRRRDEQNLPLNIVHLDISPQNVLLSLEGEVKVTDFGIAKARGVLEEAGMEDTRARQLQGKFGYMSPEHASGENVDARSDLFSLGTVLYEMLTGVNPFSAPTSFETLRRVVAVEVPPVQLLREGVPSELITLLATAMAPKPEGRFQDAGRMYEALLAFLYAQGRRFSAHDLADFLQRFREPEAASPSVVLDADGAPAHERTPALSPASRKGHASSQRILAPSPIAPAPPVVDVERAAELGERREVTALAIELPGRDDDVFADRAARTIARYGGRVLSKDPEQVTALFGEGEPDGRDTELATRCALVVLRSFSTDRLPGAGLHVGRVHIANDGRATDDEKLASLVATARDLARAREGMCAASVTAMRQVRSLFVFEPLSDAPGGSRGAEGGTRTSPSTTMLVREVRAPSEAFGRFVGRKEELRSVGEMLASATRRVASVLTLRGDHGIGKTRLLLEVERRLRKGGYNVGWHAAACVPRGPELPLSGIQAMLLTLCGVAEGDSEPRIRQVIPRLRALGLQDDEVAAVLASLGASAASSGGNVRVSLGNAFRRMVQRLCEDRPHAFSWDAAHAMDAESFAVLDGALARLPNTRVLFVLAGRAGFSHPLEKLGVHGALDVVDLEPDDAEKLVSVRLGAARVPPELLRFVRDRAGGHPQMIEEVLKGLLEGRAVTVADGVVVSMKLVGQDLALPKTLRGLVASRVARLEGAERGVLQAAAVLGDAVSADVLAAMTASQLSALERRLATLEDRGFLLHTGPAELRFTSPIVREVVVDALTPEAARQMHAAAGRALQETLGARVSDAAGRVAVHLYESGDREGAGVWFAKSGEHMLGVGKFEDAARDFARALELCDLNRRETAEVSDWFAGLARSVRLVRSLPEATELCERVIARIDAPPSAPARVAGAEADREAKVLGYRVRVRIDAGRILTALHAFDAGRTQLAAAEAIAYSDPQLAYIALIAAVELSGRQGDFKRSLTLLERLQSVVASRPGDHEKAEEHKLLVSLVQTCAAMGDHAAAARYFERAEALLPDDEAAQCERFKLRAVMMYFARDFRVAALSTEQAIDAARDLGLSYEVAVNLHNLGDILLRLEDYPRAYGALKQSLAVADELGFERLSNHNRMFLAFLDGRAGAAESDAERILLQGIRYAEANDFTWDVLGGRFVHAKLLAHRGHTAAARLEYEKVRDLARAAGNRLVETDCHEALIYAGSPSSQPPPASMRGPGGLTF
jgi:serine/threonine protein kinase/tetratricopeptide (TPR) repeat protein